MLSENEVLKKLENWAENNDTVRAIILTSSRVIPSSQPDIFSDYDVELYVDNNESFLSDEWLEFWGPIMVRWPLKPFSDKGGVTRLVHFKDGIRIDFQIKSKKTIEPTAYDNGYKVIIDKDELTKNLLEPAYSKYTVTKPSQEEFTSLVNDFFWDATYIPKCLRRNEVYFAKFQLDNVIRFEHMQKIIEWHIAAQHDWSISLKNHGRDFKKYLGEDLWLELEKTFSDANIDNNWKAFFNTIVLFRKFAKEVAENLNYTYPEKTDDAVTKYCHDAKTIEMKK